MKLIVINGPAGVGKTTTAEFVHDQLYGSTLLGLDDMRRTITGYREHRIESMQVAEAMCLAAGAVALPSRDVITEGLRPHTDYVHPWQNQAEVSGASYYEFLLWADKDTVLSRAEKRGYREDGLLNPARASELWDNMNELRLKRPELTVVDTSDMRPYEAADFIVNLVHHDTYR